MKRTFFLAALLSMVGLISVALAAGTLTGKYRANVTSNALKGQLKGTWTLKFTKKGVAKFSRNGKALGHEKFSLAGTTLTLKAGGSCAGAGTYSFNLTGKTLKLTLIKDSCQPRKILLSYPFTKAH